jgi:RimJ/RimL family protein N-acetyltransferase
VTERVTLRDGSSVDIRQIGPADRDALAAMYEGVSDESRYSRFLSVHPELRDSELTYLTEIDHHDHEALVAFVPGGPMVGVVRYVRTDYDEAEPAMLITDAWQGRGLVTVMLEMLVERAREAGISVFRAPVRAGNVASFRALDALGVSAHHAVGTEVEVEVVLRGAEIDAALVRTARPSDEPVRAGGSRAPLTPATILGDLIPRRLPNDSARRTNTIVVGVSRGEVSGAVVDAAAELAHSFGAKLLLVRARRNQLQLEAEAELDVLAERARVRTPDVQISVRRTTPAAAIVDACVESGAMMAVLGPSKSRSAGGLVGAIADLVVRQAPCNVLLLDPEVRSAQI